MPAKVKGDGIVEIDPSVIYFTFSRINPTFSCGRTIASTLDQFLRHEVTPNDLPLLGVLVDKAGNYYSLNNRRLYVYKELRDRGVVKTIPVRLRQLPDTRRMREKYTPEKCALRATLKRWGHVTSASRRSQDGNDKEEEEEEETEEVGGDRSEHEEEEETDRGRRRKKKREKDKKKTQDMMALSTGRERRGGRMARTTLEEELNALNV